MNRIVLHFMLLFNFSLFAQTAEIKTDKENYELGEKIIATFEFNSNKKYDSIQNPLLEDAIVEKISKSNSYINNRSYKISESIIYKIKPLNEGDFTIESFIYYTDGQAVKANPVSVQVTATNEQRNIKRQFNTYLKKIANKEFSAALDYITPDLYEIFPKSQMMKIMEKTFNSSDADLEIKKPRILEIKKQEKFKDKYYSLVTYSLETNLKFKEDPFASEDEEERKFLVNYTKLILEQKYGEKNIKIDEDNNAFVIKSVSQAYAITDSSKEDWKFLTLDKGQMHLVKKIIPEELLKNVNNK